MPARRAPLPQRRPASPPSASLPLPPLPPHDHAGRRARARRLLADAADVTLVTAPVSVRYLTGFAGSNGQLLLGATAADDRLITDHRYEERAATEVPDLPTLIGRDAATAALLAAGDGSLAVEADHLSWSAAETLRARATEAGVALVPTTGAVARLREVKDDAEVARLELACELTQAALAWLVEEVLAPSVRPGVGAPDRTERSLAVALERRFVDTGADGVAFPSIVAGGPHSAIPHHAPTDRGLADGDLLTIDCGAVVDGYHADHTRTFAIGRPPDELVAIHELVVLAQRAGCDAVAAGRTAGEVDLAARQPIEEAGYGEAFLHGTGHGVGLEIHEAPAVGEGSAATLSAGTALTVEPGVYLPGLGGVRIEDTLVVTADGSARALTDTPRELRVL